MIEELILNHLSEGVTEPVYTETPPRPPERYYVIEHSGGGGDRFLARSQVILQSVAESLYEAAAMNARAKAVMFTLTDLDAVTKVRLDTDYNFSDPVRKKRRYQAIYEVWHYEGGN